MNKYFIFFTSRDGQELGGSHYDFSRMCQTIENFLSINKERDFLFVSACRQNDDGEIEEVVRWARGSLQPVFDLRT